jgi:hypothetical protein
MCAVDRYVYVWHVVLLYGIVMTERTGCVYLWDSFKQWERYSHLARSPSVNRESSPVLGVRASRCCCSWTCASGCFAMQYRKKERVCAVSSKVMLVATGGSINSMISRTVHYI